MEGKLLYFQSLPFALRKELHPYIEGERMNISSSVGVLKKVCYIISVTRREKTADAFEPTADCVCYCQTNMQSCATGLACNLQRFQSFSPNHVHGDCYQIIVTRTLNIFENTKEKQFSLFLLFSANRFRVNVA